METSKILNNVRYTYNKKIIVYLMYLPYMVYLWSSVQFLYGYNPSTLLHSFEGPVFVFMLCFDSFLSNNRISIFAVRVFLGFLQNQCNVATTQEGIVCQQYSCWCRDACTCREAFKYVLFSGIYSASIIVCSDLKTACGALLSVN